MLKKLRNLYFVSLLVGFIGFVTGLLLAPKSGKELTAELKTHARDDVVKLEKELKIQYSALTQQIFELEDSLNKSSTEVSLNIKKLISTGKKYQTRSKDLLTALHEGSAEQKELSELLTELREFKKSVKNYYKS